MRLFKGRCGHRACCIHSRKALRWCLEKCIIIGQEEKRKYHMNVNKILHKETKCAVRKASLDAAVEMLEAELDSLKEGMNGDPDMREDEILSMERAIRILKGEEHLAPRENGPSYEDYPSVLSHIGGGHYVPTRNKRDSFETNIGPLHGRED